MKKNHIHLIIDYVITVVMVIFISLSWIWGTLGDRLFPYGAILVFIALGSYFLNHVNLQERIKNKDYELLLVIITCIVSIVNMWLVGSNIGAFFTIANLLLLLYLSDKVVLPSGCIKIISGMSFLILIVWLFIYRPDYGNVIINPNGAASIVFTCAAVLIAYIPVLKENILKKCSRYYIITVIILGAVMIQSIALKSRGVMLGTSAIAVSLLFVSKKKWILNATLFFTLVFPIIYVYIWKSGLELKTLLFTKSILSGREFIWYDFFKVFMKYPITGIGSDFETMMPDALYTVVHHALLDILFVHGIPVFISTVCLLMYKLYGILKSDVDVIYRSVVISILLGILVLGTFENNYIVAPYNFMFFLVLNIIHSYKVQLNAEKNFQDKM